MHVCQVLTDGRARSRLRSEDEWCLRTVECRPAAPGSVLADESVQISPNFLKLDPALRLRCWSNVRLLNGPLHCTCQLLCCSCSDLPIYFDNTLPLILHTIKCTDTAEVT